ncbi:MAG: 1-acyl-sn-glycerol-3-phosphate acyltransferase [Clostridiales bacterium]|nr:1-acyl-sn-glycerol-3-phosphate acyltransferase [Clostridiales bacterium]
MKAFDFETVPQYRFYSWACSLFGPLVRVIYRIEYQGTENIPDQGGYILALNHTSAMDPVFAALPKAVPPLHFMAKIELFRNPVMAWIMTHLYAFPVNRGKGDTAAVNYGIQVVREGNVMAICPEGRRITEKNGVPQQAKPGVAIIAKAAEADVLPVAIYCDGKIKPFRKVTVIYGALIPYADLELDEKLDGEEERQECRRAANYVMAKIIALWVTEHGRRGKTAVGADLDSD